VRATALLVAKELRVQFRRGSVFILGFAAPFTLAFVMNLVFGGMDDPGGAVQFDVAVADLDGGTEAEDLIAILDGLAESGLLDLSRVDDEEAARAAVDDGEVGAAWVIPTGFSEAVAGGGEAEILILGDVDTPTTASVARAIADRYATGVGVSTLAALVAVDTGAVGPDQVGEVAAAVASAPPPAVLARTEADAELLDTTTNLIAGMALFFVFFTAGLPVVGVLEERSQGTLARLLAAPIPTGAIVAGKLVAAIILGTTSIVALMVASTLLMGADFGPPAGAVLVAVAAVFAAAGVMTVAGSLARSTEQAGNAQSIVAVVFAILGGAFVPIPGSDTGILSTLQQLTPHGWFFDGVAALQHDGFAEALPAVGVLLAMGAAGTAIGLWTSRWALRR
jgi:ABC-2 type transport system permease protein